jgi:peptidoglycan hydrolase-like protein with peptidoglycan-binding domain
MSIVRKIIFFGFIFSSGFAFATSTHHVMTKKIANQSVLTTKDSENFEKERIRTLQKKLSREGYYSGAINGEKTVETRQAIKNWARDRD